MSDFVYDNTAVPDGKVDNAPLGVPSNKGITAAEWNTTLQAIKDLRHAVLSGNYHGLVEAAASLSGLGTGRMRLSGGRIQISENAKAFKGALHPDVNLLDFGADPTGVADSSPAFMAAIASFGPPTGATAFDAGTIIVPPGTYRLASTVRVKKCVWIKGSHNGSGCDIAPDPGITAFKFERANVSTDLGTASADGARLSNIRIYNPGGHKVAIWQQGHNYTTIGTRVKVGPAPGQGLKVFTDINEYYRHYELTTPGTSAGSGTGPKSQGNDQLLNYKSQTVNFTVGSYVTGGTSGAEGKIIADTDSGATGTLRITSWTEIPFQDNEALTDRAGGAATANGTNTAAGVDELDGAARWKFIGAGAGVHIRANGVELHDVTIIGMSGAGAHIFANDNENPGQFVNANGWQFFNVGIGNCDGHGLYLRGSDANGGTWIGGACAGNGGPSSDESFSGPGFNIYDASFLGNTYVGVELYTVGGQGCIFTNSIGGGCSFIGCYQEGNGGGYNIAVSPVVVIGGGVADATWKGSGYATGQTSWLPTNEVRQIGTSGGFGLVQNIQGLSADPWRSDVTIPQGIYRANDGGKVYISASEGHTALSGGPTGTGSGIVDNTATWNYVGQSDPGIGFVRLGSPDFASKTIMAAQVPDDVGVGFSWGTSYVLNAGTLQNVICERYGSSGSNPSEFDGDGAGIMTAQNKTLMGEWPMLIPAGKNAVDMMWIGGSRLWASATAADPTFGTWNPGDRIYYKAGAVTPTGATGRRCTVAGTSRTYGGVRTATADGSTTIVLSGAADMSSLKYSQEFRVGDWVTVGGSARRQVTAVSPDGLTLTLNGTVSAGAGKAMVFSAPTFVEFGAPPVLSLTAVGAAPNADGASATGNTLTLQPADGSHPGLMAASDFTKLGNQSGSNSGDLTLAAVGSAPSANGATLSGQALTLQPADGTHPGLMAAADFTKLGNQSGTNSGDLTLAAVGASPSANGATLAGQALTLQPADGTHPGLLSILAQTIQGVKTFLAGIVSNYFMVGAPDVSAIAAYVATVYIAARFTGYGAIWFAPTATSGNFALSGSNGLDTQINSGTGGAVLMTLGGNTIVGTADAAGFTTDRKLKALSGIGVGNSAAATTPGTVVKKVEIFDYAGVSLGFIAVYDAIT